MKNQNRRLVANEAERVRKLLEDIYIAETKREQLLLAESDSHPDDIEYLFSLYETSRKTTSRIENTINFVGGFDVYRLVIELGPEYRYI